MSLCADDRLEIQELSARYARALDLGDEEGFASCFVPDGVMESSSGTLVGAEQLRGRVREARSRQTFRHYATNFICEELPAGPDGALRARGEASFIYLFVEPDGRRIDLTGRYEDELVKTGAGWRIARRRIVLDSSR